MTLDLSRPLAIHVVGVGGAGMSAIASVLAAMGHRVSGSDLRESIGLVRLRAQGVDVTVPHDAARVVGVDVVAVSTAVPDHNPEVRAAHDQAIPVLRRAEILAAIAAVRRTVAVSGTHGKTSTSSMLALVLAEAGMRPSFIVGGELNEIGTGAAWDQGDWFVVEADESDGTFTEIGAEVAVVTNVEPDHLDFYGSFGAVEAAFDRFLSLAPGPNVVGADEPTAAGLARAHGALTFGTAADADYRLVDLTTDRAGVAFTLRHGADELGRLSLPVPGAYNARNAAAATVAALTVGASFDAARRALARYAGVVRRFQHRGTVGGVTLVDDYAHNPGKVAAVLAAARAGGWRRVVAVFQPHRFSRTATLGRSFGPAFADADVAVITEIYAAGEAPLPGVTAKVVVDAILEHHPGKRVVWLPHRRDVVTFLDRELQAGDLCLTLGAGDITGLADELNLEHDRAEGAA